MSCCWVPLPTRRRTRGLARALAQGLQPGDLLVLSGPLGCGKTFLTRALCRARGLDESIPVSSPSFPLVRELPTTPPIAHADLYRLETSAEARSLGLDELRTQGFALIVEWGERFPEALGPDALTVNLSRPPRAATLSAGGPASSRRLALALEHPELTAASGARRIEPDETPGSQP